MSGRQGLEFGLAEAPPAARRRRVRAGVGTPRQASTE